MAQVTIREEEDIEPRVTTKEFASLDQLAHELDFEIKTLPSGSKKVNEQKSKTQEEWLEAKSISVKTSYNIHNIRSLLRLTSTRERIRTKKPG